MTTQTGVLHGLGRVVAGTGGVRHRGAGRAASCRSSVSLRRRELGRSTDRDPASCVPGRTHMDDGITALRKQAAAARLHGRLPRGRPGARVQPHHRRRRALALAVLAGLALIAGAVDSGRAAATAAHTRARTRRPGYFARLQTLAGTGPGSFVAAEKAAENAAINRTLAYTPYVRIAGAQHKEIALTFDDGPGPYTPQVVVGARAGERAGARSSRSASSSTYFHAGDLADRRRRLSRSAITPQTTPRCRSSRRGDQRAAAAAADRGHPAATAPRSRACSARRTGCGTTTTLRLLHKYRMLMVLWTVDTNDYRAARASTAIVHTAVSGARPGAIILMHDAGGNRSETVAALPIDHPRAARARLQARDRARSCCSTIRRRATSRSRRSSAPGGSARRAERSRHG